MAKKGEGTLSKEDAPTFSLDIVCQNARAVFGVQPETVTGALRRKYGVDYAQKQYAKADVAQAIKEYMKH